MESTTAAQQQLTMMTGECVHIMESFINGWTCSTSGTYYVQLTGYNNPLMVHITYNTKKSARH